MIDDAAREALEKAYVRGATWSLEMGMHYKLNELHKAARDYADKATSLLNSGQNLADANSKRTQSKET